MKWHYVNIIQSESKRHTGVFMVSDEYLINEELERLKNESRGLWHESKSHNFGIRNSNFKKKAE